MGEVINFILFQIEKFKSIIFIFIGCFIILYLHYVFFIKLCRCPKCKKISFQKVIETKFLSSSYDNKTFETVRYYFKCPNCSHRWTRNYFSIIAKKSNSNIKF